MPDKLFSEFFKKNWISFIISIGITVATAFVIPKDIAERLPFGKYNQYIFYFFIFVLVFGLILLFVWVYRRVTKSNFSDICLDSLKDQQLDELWKKIDSYNEDEYKDILDFIKSKNKPIVKTAHYLSGLYASSLVISSNIGTRKANDSDGDNIKNDLSQSDLLKMAIAQDRKSYMLDPDVYDLLKYSYKKYQKICHFR